MAEVDQNSPVNGTGGSCRCGQSELLSRSGAFGDNGPVAIEDNVIAGNTFLKDETAIRLWWNPTQDPNWGYPKLRDTDSRDYLIAGNTFTGVRTQTDVTRITPTLLTSPFRIAQDLLSLDGFTVQRLGWDRRSAVSHRRCATSPTHVRPSSGEVFGGGQDVHCGVLLSTITCHVPRS